MTPAGCVYMQEGRPVVGGVVHFPPETRFKRLRNKGSRGGHCKVPWNSGENSSVKLILQSALVTGLMDAHTRQARHNASLVLP